MEEIITYSLKNGQKRSDQYYREIAAFSDEVLAEIKTQAADIVTDFQHFIEQNECETRHSFAEYAFELLILGVLCGVHGGTALKLADIPQRILSSLGKLRKRYPALKPMIDFWRGVLGTLFLTPQNESGGLPDDLTLQNLDRLLDWMTASGDFAEEVKRLRPWQEFMEGQKPPKLAATLKTATSLAAWFEHRSLEVLGRYTPNVDAFLAEKHPDYRWREDVIFCGRQRVEYHLYMVGSEILNRAFREAFLQTKRRVVLLPPCMKAKLEAGCLAQETPLGERCAACTPGCRVHQATKLGEKYGFDVFIMPHELSVFSNGGISPSKGEGVGIVGVSCPLTNMTGGWETKDMGVPAQGLLLDYCGCPWHWHEQGIATDINLHKLLEIMGIEEKGRA
jgi:hypothetical protein